MFSIVYLLTIMLPDRYTKNVVKTPCCTAFIVNSLVLISAEFACYNWHEVILILHFYTDE